jgi:CRISPR-associated endonuclease/helicase Cas3
MQRQEDSFAEDFAVLTGFPPFHWQRRLFRSFVQGKVPAGLDLPTGLGKTSVMAIWLIARAYRAPLPRRLVYVVDRRAVVDQATEEAVKLRASLEDAKTVKAGLGLGKEERLPISTLRGRFIDNREWLADPAMPAIIVGTVDMIGSRLLFSGYGVSRKMRSYQAGLLGVDALIVLDEAHLVPPFAHLLRSIERDTSLQPSNEGSRALVPRFVFLPLSATQRDLGADTGERKPFPLEEEDWVADGAAARRLKARKCVRLEPLREKEQDRQLAEAALALAAKNGEFSRVVVFCDRRDRQDGGGGTSAQGVKGEIEKLARGDRKARRAEVDIHLPELLVGARRVHERDRVADRLSMLGFVGKKQPLEKPAFLVATAAGEVGVDIDAEHMVSDLTSWERMAQRLGRVNRRGDGNAEIKVFWSTPSIKDAGAPTPAEKRSLVAFASKAVVEALPRLGGGFDASPLALRQLGGDLESEEGHKDLVSSATTPEPLRPAINRALVDSWSMTSLEGHAGRPDVRPWLRGWVDDDQQTSTIWRNHLPIRIDDSGRTIIPDSAEIEDFFEAAPPHESEKLDTETYRVTSWLQERALALAKRSQSGKEEGTTQSAPQLQRDDIVALVLSVSGAFERHYKLGELARERKGRDKEDLHLGLGGNILVVDARFGGLSDGLLDSASDAPFETADSTEDWSKEVLFRVRRVVGRGPEDQDDRWWFEAAFDLRRNEEGNPLEQLIVEHFGDAARKEDARSISNPQELSVHQTWARSRMMRIARAAGLAEVAANALAVGAGLHDEGKKASRWQRAFKARRDAERFRLVGPLAKTRGPIDQAVLGRYRHEFGSLLRVEEDPEFKDLPDDWRDLILHVVAAHHGQARPSIENRDCEDGPPSQLEERARAVALRFARLQKRWGPWGLAWWEMLLRAADQQASRDNEAGMPPGPNGDP